MTRQIASTIGFLIAAQGILTPAGASPDGTAPLTKEEREVVLAILKEATPFRKEAEGKKVRLSTAVAFSKKPAGSDRHHRFARVLSYRYDDGKTLRTTLDLDSREVVKVDVLEGYPTPPGPEEEPEARKVAEEKDEAVVALRKKFKDDELAVTFLSPSVPERDAPLFRKRLVTVYYTPRSGQGGVVWSTVNLTDGAIVGH